MALARILCGQCGADIPTGATACPKCGTAVDLPGPGVVQESGQTCPLCGYRNAATASFCESCGAKLSGGNALQKGRGKKSGASSSARGKESAQQRQSSSQAGTWQVISGVAVLALIAVLVYLLLSRDEGGTIRTSAAPQPSAATASLQQIESLQQVVDANPRDASARLHLANVLHDNGMLTRAIDNYNEYLELQPKDPDARVDLGICYDQLALQDSANAPRYFAQAVQEMQTAVKDVPTHQPAAFNLGIVNLQMGNLEESNRWFKRAVALDSTSDLGRRAQKIIQEHTFAQ